MALGFKPGGLFGSQFQLPGPIGGYGGGTWNADGTQATPVDRHNYAIDGDAPARKGGIFAPGGVGRNIAGAIGDALLQMNRMEPIFAPQMQHRQAMAARQQQAERERMARREDMQWEWQNKPRSADQTAMQQNYDFLNTVDPTLGKAYLKRQTDPIQWITGPDGIPRPFSVGGAPSADAPETLPRDFDFGSPSQPATGMFPDPLKGPGRVTSMRRTAQGNRDVGGVPGSRHLTGEAVDVVGATPEQLRSYYGQSANIGWHKNHHHVVVPGAQFPFYGKRGSRGAPR